MIIPEGLFGLPLLKDIKTQQIELVLRRLTLDNFPGSEPNQKVFTVPSDRVGVCFAWQARIEPGAAAQVLYAYLATSFDVVTDVLSSATPIPSSFGPSPLRQSASGGGQFWLPPGADVRVGMELAAGNIGHVYFFTAGILTFPRGNVSLG